MDDLFEKLHTDADAILPLLLAYQEAFVSTEMHQLSLLSEKQEEDRCFANLTKELYGVEKKRLELHDMENKM